MFPGICIKISVCLKPQFFVQDNACGVVSPHLILYYPISKRSCFFHHQSHAFSSVTFSSFITENLYADLRVHLSISVK